MIERMIRVDHAGELAADRIYAGQTAVLSTKSNIGALIQRMWNDEKEHLSTMEQLIARHRVPPTRLAPVWSGK
jgi:ubiquinone biosynthesis monooxygenase Coq7